MLAVAHLVFCSCFQNPSFVLSVLPQELLNNGYLSVDCIDFSERCIDICQRRYADVEGLTCMYPFQVHRIVIRILRHCYGCL